LLVTELRELNDEGPHFRIVHRFHVPGTDCAPGEEVAGVYLIYRGREFHLRLSLALRLLFDYLARHSHLSQSATQIEAGIRADRFYAEHAANVHGSAKQIRSIPRSYVRVYMDRLRSALQRALQEASLELCVDRVLISQATVMNEATYRIKACIEWVHLDL
jgi:hypothetical protein